MSRGLYRFPGGVHPPEHKSESNTRPIHPPLISRQLIIPLRQHRGAPAKPIVAVGERVLKGQMIAAADGAISAAVHASSSGIVSAIGLHAVPHASGLPDVCITIDTDGLDEWTPRTPLAERQLPPAELLNALRDFGLAGLGGAVFPSTAKLDAPEAVSTLILNGGECEPWITCDDVLMRQYAREILQGASVMRELLGSSEILVGIEDNKPEAIAAMQAAAATFDFEIEVVALPTRYPSGGGKQMIQMLTGKEVPSGKLPTDIGIQMFNVGTAYALYRAMFLGEPLISRVVTVTGHVLRPQNMHVLIGTPMQTLIDAAGERDGASGVLMGGPMMGIALASTQVPVVKATNCVLVQSRDLFPAPPPVLPCIRCACCADACPVKLQPQDLYRFAKVDDFERVEAYHLFDCIECGCCNYVCPSHIPLVDFYRYAKSQIAAREQDKRAADLARERHEFRLMRLDRDKREKAAKLAARTQAQREALATENKPEADAKRALIAAALARAQASKSPPRNVDNLPPHAQQQIDEADARRAAADATSPSLSQEKT